MIYLTQLIYEFEAIAIPIILKYNGRLTLRIRPDDNSIIECDIEKPYEIHLVEFNTQADFDNFKEDKDRKSFLHLKEKSIRTSILIQGTKL